jgi:hypothetical protein
MRSKVVHLDHLIKRQSIRFYNKEESDSVPTSSQRLSDTNIRYNDITSLWFNNIRKPDFQRETNAWDAEQCCEFIESVFMSRIIPSIILWKSEDNGLVYVLDGAHRLSIIRAWMTDDYGDKHIDYYERRDIETIKQVANETRSLINIKVGSYESFKESYNVLQIKTDEGKAPRTEMSDKSYRQAKFYSDIIAGNAALFAQWEKGNYESAEQSFLRINRQGQPLNPAESTLIEYRKGSYSRAIMHISNAGEEGYYWPKDNIPEAYQSIVLSFSETAKYIYERLFVPSFTLPIRDLSVPLLVAPAYFQKHNYLMELIPLLVWNTISDEESYQLEYLSRDHKEAPEVIIQNAQIIFKNIDNKLNHLTSFNNDPKSLSIVPLFYWYNERGQFTRALFYSWVYWLFQGTEDNIFQRKLIYTSNRENIELIFFHFKKEITAYAAKSGAGLKAVKNLSIFFEKIINYFHERRNEKNKFEDLENTILTFLGERRQSKNIVRDGRTTTIRDKTQANINEMFKSSIRCHICGGIVDLKFGGIQYDHLIKYKTVKVTDPENLRPSHPFCNNNRDKIESYRKGTILIERPMMKFDEPRKTIKTLSPTQLTLFDIEFPD